MGRAPTRPDPGDLTIHELFPCSETSLADHPPLDGRSDVDAISGVTGRHCRNGVGVSGTSAHTGVRGDGDERGVVGATQNGIGVHGTSKIGEGVRGETWSTNFAAVAGLSHSRRGHRDGGFSSGVWGSSQAGEGVHGETSSAVFAAVAGIQLNPRSTGAGIYGEHRGA